MGKLSDAFKDWLDGGEDDPANQAERVTAEDAKKPEDEQR